MGFSQGTVTVETGIAAAAKRREEIARKQTIIFLIGQIVNSLIVIGVMLLCR